MRAFIGIGLIIMVGLVSCNRCKDKVCLNGGVCDDGECLCLPGFEGDSCQLGGCATGEFECENDRPCVSGECDCGEWYDGDRCEELYMSKFYGQFDGSEDCSGISVGDNYYILSRSGASENKMLAEDRFGYTVQLIMDDEQNFTVRDRDGGNQVEGNGSFTGNDQINFSYTQYDNWGSVEFSCSFSGTR